MEEQRYVDSIRTIFGDESPKEDRDLRVKVRAVLANQLGDAVVADAAIQTLQNAGIRFQSVDDDVAPTKIDDFRSDLKHLINKYSLENESGTPDFILAEVAVNALLSYDKAVLARAHWRSESVNGIHYGDAVVSTEG